jgi:hypothetical protein
VVVVVMVMTGMAPVVVVMVTVIDVVMVVVVVALTRGSCVTYKYRDTSMVHLNLSISSGTSFKIFCTCYRNKCYVMLCYDEEL